MKRQHAHSFVCRVRNLSRQTECFPKAAAGFIFNIHQEEGPKNFWRGKALARREAPEGDWIPLPVNYDSGTQIEGSSANEPVGNSRRFPIGATKKKHSC